MITLGKYQVATWHLEDDPSTRQQWWDLLRSWRSTGTLGRAQGLQGRRLSGGGKWRSPGRPRCALWGSWRMARCFVYFFLFYFFSQVPALTVFVIELLEGNRTLYKPCGRHLGSQEGWGFPALKISSWFLWKYLRIEKRYYCMVM